MKRRTTKSRINGKVVKSRKKLFYPRTEADDFYDRDKEKEAKKKEKDDLQLQSAKKFIETMPSAITKKICEASYLKQDEKKHEVPFMILTPVMAINKIDQYVHFLREISAEFPTLINNREVWFFLENYDEYEKDEQSLEEFIYKVHIFDMFLDNDGDISSLLVLKDWIFENNYEMFVLSSVFQRGDTFIYVIKFDGNNFDFYNIIANGNSISNFFQSNNSGNLLVNMIRFH